jgi:hypothetical protein
MTLSHEEIINRWGESGVVRLTPARADALGIVEPVREALTHLGVPREIGYLFVADEQPQWVSGGGCPERHLRFGWGWYGESAICVEAGSGLVVAVTGGPPGAVEHGPVNRAVAEFVEFLYHIDRFWLSAEQRDAVTDYTPLARLRGLDPSALGQGYWWTNIIDEMKMGMI